MAKPKFPICSHCDDPRLCKICLATESRGIPDDDELRDEAAQRELITFPTLESYNYHMAAVHGRCPSCGGVHPEPPAEVDA